MTKVGESILRGAREALAFTKGKITGAIVHMAAKVPDGIDIKAIREKLALSQAGFALKFGLTPPPHSIRNWEQGTQKPSLQARTFLKVIERNTKAVREALTA